MSLARGISFLSLNLSLSYTEENGDSCAVTLSDGLPLLTNSGSGSSEPISDHAIRCSTVISGNFGDSTGAE